MFYSAFDIRLQHDRSCEAVSVMEKASVFLPSLVTDSPLPVTSPLPNSRSAPLFTRSFHRYSTAGGAALELCFKNWKANEIQACQAVQLQKKHTSPVVSFPSLSWYPLHSAPLAPCPSFRHTQRARHQSM